MSENHLIVALADSLEAIERKGEVLPRYFNPLNIFSKITFVSVHSRRITKALQLMAGTAAIELIHVGRPPLDAMVLPRARSKWITPNFGNWKPGRRSIVRSYGLGSAGILGLALSKQFGLPLICSVHGEHDVVKRLRRAVLPPMRRTAILLKESLYRGIEKQVISQATEVIAVYSSAASFANRLGAKRVAIIPNVVSDRISPKSAWGLSAPPRLINIGAQEFGVKEPSTIIRALEDIEVDLDIFGDGSANSVIVDLAKRSLHKRIHVHGSIQNSDLAAILHTYDIAVFRTHAPELSKVVIEAGLAALPIVVNRQASTAVPELVNSGVIQVNDDEIGWSKSIHKLLLDQKYRSDVAQETHSYFYANFNPTLIEHQHAALYKSHLNQP